MSLTSLIKANLAFVKDRFDNRGMFRKQESISMLGSRMMNAHMTNINMNVSKH